MALYVAYGLVVMHVALGIMQYERTLLIPAMLIGGFAMVTVLHLVAGWRERAGDRGRSLASRRLDRRRRAGIDSGQVRADRRRARRRAHRGVSRRRADRRAHQSLRPPERPDRRGPHHRRLRDLSLARFSVSAGGRLRAAAVHREARDLSSADQEGIVEVHPDGAAAWHTGGHHISGSVPAGGSPTVLVVAHFNARSAIGAN